MYIRSRSHLASEKDAVTSSIKELVSKQQGVKDATDLDLYDESFENVTLVPTLTWGALIGELRWQSVKSAPKDEDLALKCFQACLSHEDWEHAQQVGKHMK